MPRRFAILLLTVLSLLTAGLLTVRVLKDRKSGTNSPSAAVRVPTPLVPPTPIPPKRVVLYFESPDDELFHPETRDIAASVDDVALIRAITAAVLDGPFRSDLLRPFPQGWKLRAAYRLANGLLVVDLAPPESARTPAPGLTAAPADLWETGSRDEWNALQAITLTVTKNAQGVTRILFTVGGEPVETLGGHIDLTHPVVPSSSLLANEPLGTPPPTPSPTPTLTPGPPTAPTVTPTREPVKKPRRTPMPTSPEPVETPVEGF